MNVILHNFRPRWERCTHLYLCRGLKRAAPLMDNQEKVPVPENAVSQNDGGNSMISNIRQTIAQAAIHNRGLTVYLKAELGNLDGECSRSRRETRKVLRFRRTQVHPFFDGCLKNQKIDRCTKNGDLVGKKRVSILNFKKSDAFCIKYCISSASTSPPDLVLGLVNIVYTCIPPGVGRSLISAAGRSCHEP